jgi:methionyl-tRNA formyltransferase
MTRIVFMGTPAFAVPSLARLLATQEVVGVVTQPDRPAGRGRALQAPPVKQLAMEAAVPVYQPRSLRPAAAAEPLRAWQPELIVVAAFGQILRSHVLQLPPLGCLNVHASLLPRWRGAAPIQHAILAGDDETGVSLMRMDEGLDTGPVYVQQALPIGPDETAASLHDRLARLGADLLGERLGDIAAGRLQPRAQDDSQATYAPQIKKEDGRIDWHLPALQIERHIRAMSPWPGAFTTWQGRPLKILAADVLPAGGRSIEPGRVVEVQGRPAVGTVAGLLVLSVLQQAGRRAMATEEFLRGRPEFTSARLAP